MAKSAIFTENTEGVSFDAEGMSYVLNRDSGEDFVIRAGIEALFCSREKLIPVKVINLVPMHGRIPCIEVQAKKGGEVLFGGCGRLYPLDYKS